MTSQKLRISFLVLLAIIASEAVADDKSTGTDTEAKTDREIDTRPGMAPDIRDDESKLKVQHGNFVAVPIPISNPTLGDGLVGGAAYFYAQSDEKQQSQPASMTAIAAMYTSSDSKALGIAQQSYWRDDKWRFTGATGAADIRLSLLAPDESTSGQSVDWRIKGEFFYAKLATRVRGNWYGGVLTRLINAEQSFETPASDDTFDMSSDILSVGVGVYAEYDTRDMPISSYSGRYFKVDALFNDTALGSDSTYQSYNAAYRSYRRLNKSIVLAWELQACHRKGDAPLWDACTVKLRGFPATDYLGKASGSGQAELRWQLNKRWGLVGFAGAGIYSSSFNDIREHQAIPSYGIGVRFSVLAAKRVNLRVDYARSTDSNAVYVSVGEAF
ncbi:MAG TPA: hypothetical protein PKK10_13665 [Woeseiaceae bacterium]|nr:hypothetical protein [Woeseiaceae bacterium]